MSSTAIPTARLRHNLFLAVAMMAVFGFIVAFVQADRGRTLYQEYVLAYETCFYGALASGAADRIAVAKSCGVRSHVIRPLTAHRQAYAVGEPFLYLGVFLTLGLVLAPALSKKMRPRLPDARNFSASDAHIDIA